MKYSNREDTESYGANGAISRRSFAKGLLTAGLVATTRPALAVSHGAATLRKGASYTMLRGNKPHYVLVHGAWLGGWCWEKVASGLKKSGASVDAGDLPGHGSDQTPVPSCTMDSYVDHVSKLVEAQGVPVVLVGHSMAGVVISQVAERMPEKISTLVYVAAYLLRPGETIAKAGELANDSHVGANIVMAQDYSTASIKQEGLRDVFCADASEQDVNQVTSRFRPEPAAPFMFPVNVTGERWGKVPRIYIQTMQDHAVTPAMQKAMLGKTSCNQILSLDCSHTPFLAKAQELSGLLVKVGHQAVAA